MAVLTPLWKFCHKGYAYQILYYISILQYLIYQLYINKVEKVKKKIKRKATNG